MKETAHKNRLSGLLGRNSACFASALIAAVIMLFTYIVWQFFPFGENIILRMDLYHQYAPLFAELYERIFGGDSLIYSFTSGLGSSFLGNYFNYLSSPTLLFVLIFGHVNIPEAIAAMVLVKAAASAYTFTYFLGKVTKKSDVSTACFGLLYAFSGYFIAYYWNVMWLDAVVMFPIVILGIYYIIEQERAVTYTLSLAYIMITNYYMAYMVCLLAIVFFIYLYFSQNTLSQTLNDAVIIKEKYKKTLPVKFFNSKFLLRGTTFAGASVLAALLAAFSLLPVYFILRHSSATNSNFPSSFSSYFTIFDFLANHLAGVEPTIRSSGDAVYPNVYCGILTLVLVPVFVMSKKFSLREKIATTAVASVFFLSFNINWLNFIWHGLHFPNDLPYRFSFAYSFFLLFVAYRVFTKIASISSRDILVSASLVAGFAIIVEKVGSANVDLKVVWTSVIFAVIYAVVLAFIKNPRYVKSSVSVLLMTCICAELLISDTPNYTVTQTKDSYTSSYKDTKTAVDFVKEREGEDGFYRMELATLLTRMDNCWFYYPGVSTFTSMAYEDVAHLQDHLGLFGNKINSYTYNMQTPLYNSMMSLKYIVDNADYVPTDNYNPPVEGDFLYTEVESFNDMTVYEYNYWLPVAFCVNETLASAWIHNVDNPFVVQNDFFYHAGGVSDILSPLEGEIQNLNNIEQIDASLAALGEYSVYKQDEGVAGNEISVKYTVTQAQNVYMYFECDSVESVFVSAGGFAYNQSLSNKPYVLNIGPVDAGTEIYVTYSLKDDEISGVVRHYVYALDEEKFKNAYDIINENGVINIAENTESCLKGDITLKEDKLLYTSIPYDSAWSVYVDGVKLSSDSIVKIGDALMGIKLTAGEHTIEMRYTPAGLILGACLSLFALLVILLLFILRRKKKLMFSESFAQDVLMLGKWRDLAAEQQLELEALEEDNHEDGLDEEPSSPDSLLGEEELDEWNAALERAMTYRLEEEQSESQESENGEASEETQEEQPTDSSPEREDDGFEELFVDDYDSIFSADSSLRDGFGASESEEDGADADGAFHDGSPDDSHAQESRGQIKQRLSSQDRKSAQKKRLKRLIFVVVAVIAVAAAALVMIYAALNAGRAEEDELSSGAPIAEESSEEPTTELTTVSTTSPATRLPTTTQQATTAATTTAATTSAPTTAATTSAPTTAAPTPEYNGSFVTHTVKYGDNFYSILREYGVADTPTNVNIMCALNGINVADGLYIGQTLQVPVDL